MLTFCATISLILIFVCILATVVYALKADIDNRINMALDRHL